MGRYNHGARRRTKYRSNAGQEAARRHIQEAEAFSQEIGGNDIDVKRYFFGLSGSELESILIEYGKTYGSEAEGYARNTMHKWRSGTTKMSGMIAKRLFDLLPPRMPERKKYELAESVWLHFGPTSRHAYTAGPQTDVAALVQAVSEKLDQVVVSYGLPENVKARFNWLAAGDVVIKEQLLNHFRQLQKSIAAEKINLEIPVLQKQVLDYPDTTGLVRSHIEIHKHIVSITVDRRLTSEVNEGDPEPLKGTASGSLWWLWIVGAAIVFFLMSRR
ncbi:hypothetical protein D3X12_18555 [Pseudomonas protegens]|jgi:hypothetical protein|uniref:Uncharacterized protein n=1 Tax=Pseudomonas protegens TaxID=380021 RepID=A0ABY2VL03_9PSED|nr:hypothetical protein [Pseudomonas protegens]ASE23791.1 hypothetical protein CEP86_26280 [Pseudomonas protegens]QEZ52559.1 hypothetical protein D3X12_18555 [Pseudomonas protegens]QEZ55388.1 hypothetical protein D4N38_00925 [Pseudomonas protegens]QEZ63825.1 hypothetical protein D4N37_13875 [Pseudomonas protegens]QIC32328.1 hypothetical protein FQ342_29055 [Pseudomonas protegens]